MVLSDLLVEPSVETFLFREMVNVLLTLLEHILPHLVLSEGDDGAGLRVLEGHPAQTGQVVFLNELAVDLLERVDVSLALREHLHLGLENRQ